MHPGAGRLQIHGEFSRPKDQPSEVGTLSRADGTPPPAPGLQVGGQSVPTPFPPDVGWPPLYVLPVVRVSTILSIWMDSVELYLVLLCVPEAWAPWGLSARLRGAPVGLWESGCWCAEHRG